MRRFSLLLLAWPLCLAAQERTPRRDRAGDPLPEGALARLGTLRLRHGDAVLALAFTPDGKALASASRDGTARLWDRATGRELRRFTGHRGLVSCLALSPDGGTLATGGPDRTVRLWDVATGKPKGDPFTLRHPVESLAFDRPGKRLAAGTNLGLIQVWELAGGKKVAGLDTGSTEPRLAFTADGENILTLNDSKAGTAGVEVRRLSDGTVLQRLGTWLHDFALSPDGKTCVVATQEGRPVLHDMAGAKAPVPLKGELPELDRLTLAWSPDGKTIAAGSLDRSVRLWDAGSGAMLRSWKTHTHNIYTVAFTPDGKTLATAGLDNTIRLWDTATGKPEASHAGAVGPVNGVAVSPDGSRAATADDDGTLRLWDAATGRPERSLMIPPGRLLAIAWSPDGKRLAAGNDAGQLILVDAADGKVRHTLPAHDRSVTALAFTRDGKLLVAGSLDRTLSVWEVSSGKQVRTILARDGAGIGKLALSADGRLVLAGGSEARLRQWDLTTGREQPELEGHTGGILGVACSPTGRLAATGGRDELLRIWEVAGGRERRVLSGGGGWVHSVVWSRDGRLIASGHHDGRVCLWDAHSGLRLRILRGHDGAVNSLAFSLDGKHLGSSSADTTGLLWDLASVELNRPEPLRLTDEKVEAHWSTLRSADAIAAGDALQTLARDPVKSMALLRKKVRPVFERDIKKYLADLESRSFPMRTQAAEQLVHYGRSLEPVLLEVLEGKPSLEVRRRVEDILAAVTREGRSPEELRAYRALELLEMLGTDDARKLLKELAAGAPNYELTREAKGILERMTKPSSDNP